MSMDKSIREHRTDDRSLSEQAADWVVELAEGGPEEHSAFLEWAAESPRHIEEYLLAAMLYRRLDGLDGCRQIDLQKLLLEASFKVTPLGGRQGPSQAAMRTSGQVRSRKRSWQMLSAAAFASLCLAGATWWALQDRVHYSTGIGELRSVELADGSVVELNTQSRVEIRYSEFSRRIRLVAGEALFKVAADPARPFVVDTETATIRALGTAFNVYRRHQETLVAVINGAVQVSSHQTGAPSSISSPTTDATTTRLAAGKGLRISSQGEIKPIASVDAAKVTAWRERRLVFVDDTLADIVAEFNRYNTSPLLRVEGRYAQERQLTGVFDAGDPRSLVQFLQNLGEFEVRTEGDEIVVIRR